ncbi:MAG: hypothetical protein AAGD13_12270 [Pseudomonadota bacterium]
MVGLLALICAAGWWLLLTRQARTDPPAAAESIFTARFFVVWLLLLVGVCLLVPWISRRLLSARFAGLGWVCRRLVLIVVAGMLFFTAVSVAGKFGAFSAGAPERIFGFFSQTLLVAAVCVILFAVAARISDKRRPLQEDRFPELEGEHVRYGEALAGSSDFHSSRGAAGSTSDDWRARVMARHIDSSAAARTAARHEASRLRTSDFWNPSLVLFTCLAILSGTGLYGAHAQFLPDAEHMRFSLSIQTQLIAALSFITAIVFAAWPAKGSMFGSFGQFFAGLCFGGMFSAFIALAAVPHGLPGLHSLWTRGTDVAIRVEVVDLGRKIVRRGCNYTVYVAGTGEFDSGKRKLCGVPEAIWERLVPGQSLILEGHRTAYGMRYERFRL